MASRVVHVERLKDISGTDITSYALTNTVAVKTRPIDISNSDGFAALIVTLAGASDDVDIDYEVSDNGVDWYTPYDFSLTDIGTCIDGLTQGSYWFILDPVPTKYIRFEFDPDADSTITAKYLHRETTRG